MLKKLKIYILLIILIIIFSSFTSNKSSLAGVTHINNANLVLDSSADNNKLPKKFRRTSDLATIKDNKNLNLKGLDGLNISGSQQFSEFNLPILIKAIGTSLPVTIVDLRQESHGFINGMPVSWADPKNNANKGLTREQVLLDENSKLKSIKLNEPITFYNHPEVTVIPTKVQDENELVSSKSLSYERIPVRDGGIPTDDMVDYFIDFVKTQPKNTWLHFHCKHGVGRTNTFMIMYDIMKNYRKVSVDDIIKRQLALSNLNEGDIKSFYNDERIGFLKRFYDYSKANGNSFNTKWSEWKKTTVTGIPPGFRSITVPQTTSGFIKNTVMPRFLYVISLDSLTPGERTMVASLQGLVNSNCHYQIYTLISSQPDYKIWLEDLKNNYKVPYKIIKDPWELINIYKNYINGYVLYSNKTPKDPSINNACSLASINNSIVINEDMESRANQSGINRIKGDCRNTDESWAYDNLWDKGLSHSIVIQLSPDKAAPLRDYAIMTKSLIFYEDNIEKTDLRDKIFSSMKGNSVCLGWGPDEYINVSTASKYGVSIVAADWSYNLTTLSAFPSMPVIKKTSLSAIKQGNFHYVTFIMSDGDNLQWNLGTNYANPKWFGYTYKSNLNLGWSISPSLYYLAPTAFRLYYLSLKNFGENNNFIVSPSGNGYMYPSKYKRNDLNSYINALNHYMKRVDENYAAVIDDSSFNNLSLWKNFTERPQIQGLFYLDYKRHDNFKGKILWSNNKPLVSCRDILWEGLESEDDLVKRIYGRANSGQINAANPEAYTFVYVHVWSKTVANVEDVVIKLRQNPYVKIVSPETFMELIKKNVKH